MQAQLPSPTQKLPQGPENPGFLPTQPLMSCLQDPVSPSVASVHYIGGTLPLPPTAHPHPSSWGHSAGARGVNPILGLSSRLWKPVGKC